MINYLLVIGSVTAKQYSRARRDMLEQGTPPTVKRLSHDEFYLRGVNPLLMRDIYREASGRVQQLLRTSFVPIAAKSDIRIPFQTVKCWSDTEAIKAAVDYNLEIAGQCQVLGVVVDERLWELSADDVTWSNWEVMLLRSKWYVAHNDGWLESI